MIIIHGKISADFSFVYSFCENTLILENYKPLFLNLVNSFMTEVPIIKKPVHWFARQINGLVSIS